MRVTQPFGFAQGREHVERQMGVFRRPQHQRVKRHEQNSKTTHPRVYHPPPDILGGCRDGGSQGQQTETRKAETARPATGGPLDPGPDGT